VTATITEQDVSAIADWAPACTMDICQSGHPEATHYYLCATTCHQWERLACTPCTEFMTAYYAGQDLLRCSGPGCTQIFPVGAVTLRIEPL